MAVESNVEEEDEVEEEEEDKVLEEEVEEEEGSEGVLCLSSVLGGGFGAIGRFSRLSFACTVVSTGE